MIKNTGDGILALFHDAAAAVEFALALRSDTVHARRENASRSARGTGEHRGRGRIRPAREPHSQGNELQERKQRRG
jgi:hypothetical protein